MSYIDLLINYIRYSAMYRWILHFDNKKGAILDFGCGKGEFVSYLRKKGQEAYGVDPEIKPMSFLFTSLARLEENIHKPFEAISLNFSLEHCDNPLLTLKELYTLLTPGGLLLIRVPNLTYILKNKELSSFQLKIPSHRHFFTPESLNKLLKKAGFTTLVTDTRLCITSALTAPCSILPNLDPMKWLYNKNVATKFVNGMTLGFLSLVFLPYVLLKSQLGEGTIIHTVAKRDNP